MSRVSFLPFPLAQIPPSHLGVRFGVGDFYVDCSRGFGGVEEFFEKWAAPPAAGARSEAVGELADPLRLFDA